MIRYSEADIKTAKEMINKVRAGGKVSASHFLPVYNRITNKNEKSNCPGCWGVRVEYLTKVIKRIEESKITEVKLVNPPTAEQVEPPKKKGRGRPKKKENGNIQDI